MQDKKLEQKDGSSVAMRFQATGMRNSILHSHIFPHMMMVMMMVMLMLMMMIMIMLMMMMVMMMMTMTILLLVKKLMLGGR